MTIAELKEKHPTAVKVAKSITIIAGTITVYYVVYVKGARIEITMPKDREIRRVDIGHAQDILNGIRGAQARGFDTSKAQAEYDAIISPYC